MRLRVTPGTSTGKPALSAASRAMLAPCSPMGETHPKTTSCTSAGSTPARRAASHNTCAIRSSGVTLLSAPPGLPTPTGVRTAEPVYRRIREAVALLAALGPDPAAAVHAEGLPDRGQDAGPGRPGGADRP